MPGGIIRTYKNGKLSGDYSEFDQRGKFVRGGYYRNGSTNGHWLVPVDESWGLEEKFGIKAYSGAGLYEKETPEGLWCFRDENKNPLALIDYTFNGPVLLKTFPPK